MNKLLNQQVQREQKGMELGKMERKSANRPRYKLSNELEGHLLHKGLD